MKIGQIEVLNALNKKNQCFKCSSEYTRVLQVKKFFNSLPENVLSLNDKTFVSVLKSMARSDMCKPATVLANDQVLQRLSCSSNGVSAKMDSVPSCSIPNVVGFSDKILEGIEQNKTPNTTPSSQNISNENLHRFCGAKSFINKFCDFPSLDDDQLEDNLINSISPARRVVVDKLIEKIKKLSILQQILLYVKLPFCNEDPDRLDPLRRPLNPLGNRSQVSQALAYIKTHFVPDPDVSLPKKEMYIEYTAYCMERKLKPLSNADFGKAMKQVYPVIRPRRLGERGKSRYCYSGLRNRDKLSKPWTPGQPTDQERQDISEKICDWASKVLNVQVDNLLELSKILPETALKDSELLPVKKSKCFSSDEPKIVPEKKQKLVIEEEDVEIAEQKPLKPRKASNQSKLKPQKAASSKRVARARNQALLVSKTDKLQSSGKSIKSQPTISVTIGNSAHTQSVSLIRGNQGESVKNTLVQSSLLTSSKLPRACQDQTSAFQHKRKAEVFLAANDKISTQPESSLLISSAAEKRHKVNSMFGNKAKSKLITLNNQSKVCDITNQKQVNIDKINIDNSCINHYDLSTEKSTNLEKSNKAATDKHVALNVPQQPRYNSRIGKYINKEQELRSQCLPTEDDNFGIASIEEDIPSEDNSIQKLVPIKQDSSDILTFSFGLENDPNYYEFMSKNNININFTKPKSNDQTGTNSDVGCLRMNSLGSYLPEEGNSQEPEEELLKYFKDPVNYEKKNVTTEKNKSQNGLLLEHGDQILLEENPESNSKSSERDTGFSEEEHLTSIKLDDLKKSPSIQVHPILLDAVSKSSMPSTLLSNYNKRRVSFENVPDALPHSPNTQRKNFIFIPISPRPSTVSKSTVNISPFAFPHETALRGKLSSSSYGNIQPNPTPSPVLQKSNHIYKQMSPMKSFSQLTSLSSSPSPIISGCSSTSNMHRATPQDCNQEQSDSIKSSPIISPNSSSGVFLSPASSVSSCNSPVFTFQKSLSPVKQTDDLKPPTKPNTSLLQSLLLMGKTPDIKSQNKKEMNHVPIVETQPVVMGSIAEESCQLRSRSLPTLFRNASENHGILPSSKTENSFVPSSTKKEVPSLIDLKPNDLDLLNSVLNDYKNDENLLIDDVPENGTVNNENNFDRSNEVSMESVISNLYNMLDDKDFSESSEQIKSENVSRSQPNTPFIYNDSSNSSRDPVVSAFPTSSGSKSYPSTPVCSSQAPAPSDDTYTNNTSSAKRNIIPLLDSLAIPDPSFSDEIEIHFNNFENFSSCEDTFITGLPN